MVSVDTYDVISSTTLVDTNVSVYGLVDPRTDAIRYIGKSINPERRYRDHLSPGQLTRYRSHKNSWIKGLLAVGLKPRLVVSGHLVPLNRANAAERAWIAMCRELGFDLTNGTDGGDGGAVTAPGALSRIRAAHLGRKAGEVERQRKRESALRRCANPVERERLAGISNGKPPVRRGQDNNRAKVTEEQVREIRRLAATGLTSGEIAPRFGLTYQNVWYIVTRQTWRHLSDEMEK